MLDYGNYGIFLLMGNAEFISSTLAPKASIVGITDPEAEGALLAETEDPWGVSEVNGE